MNIVRNTVTALQTSNNLHYYYYYLHIVQNKETSSAVGWTVSQIALIGQ